MDGSHLKTTYNGTFVSASTLDGAGNILPLAYGVIDSKNDKSWTWFFEQFKQAYGISDNMCVVSDRHESIIKAVSRVYPTDELDKQMDKIENVDTRVKEYFELVGRDLPVNRGWTMTSNIAECINEKLVAARELHVYNFLEEVRKMFGRWNCTNRRNGTYTFQQLLSINECKSLCMMFIIVLVEVSIEYVYTTNDEARRFIIDLKKKTCSCRMFQMDEITCPHAWVVLKSKNIVPDEYCQTFSNRR
ncbi:uncharacterized protein LOC132608016 [Lycium barbarum]|uniref:uncharacterized protein LOC132608016 n=1 Tax=Lycium barbarum TaxID=112863 RepID=UPI00293EB8E7|nr:uncharacterized protein LOC132608016 [Lycium barbarum]